jgi:hypothetical protein
MNYRTKKPQIVNDFGGEKTMIFIGYCQECTNTVYGYEGDEGPDPRGKIAPNHCASYLIASEYGMEGSDVVICYACADTRTRYDHAVKIAKQKWDAESKTYQIIRFFRDSNTRKIIKTGLTYAEAKEHCSDKSTSGDGWFDGFEEE